MTAPLHFKHLEWDSSFFGYQVAAIGPQCDDIIGILPLLKEMKYKLIYLFSETHEHELQKKVEIMGLSPIDIRVTLSCTLEKVNQPANEIEMYLTEEINDDLLQLAYRSGIYSRFATDPLLGTEKFRQLYSLWLERSLKKVIAHGTFVYRHEKKIVGFITYQLDASAKKGKIGLIAVAEGMEGKGIGTKLIHAVKHILSENGCTELEVVTQKQNLPALKLYDKSGFSITEELLIYHIWL